MKMEVETREMLPQAKEHQGSPERDKERFFPRAGSGTLLTPGFQASDPTALRQIPVAVSHPV